MRKLLPTICFLAWAFQVHATIWHIGSTQTYHVPSAVANLVSDGDIIEIDAETYLGDVSKWFANNLIFKGVGIGRAHLKAEGNYVEGKAIWVIKGKNCRVENIEFSGCKVPDQNGAGIRQEGQNLTLVNCFFHHNEMGILTNNDGVSDYVFEGCEFAENGYGDGYSHNIYVGHVHSLTMLYCYSHDAKVGHLVKSRAERNLLYYNRLTGENGDGSYEIDLPNGGFAVLIGNIIEQCTNSQNGGIISFGLEGASNVEQQIALSHNTILNNRFDGRFLQYGGTSQVTMRGNQFIGLGTLLQGTGAMLDTTHNLRILNIAAAQLTDLVNYDFRPLAASPCVNAGLADFGTFSGISLAPDMIYVHPLGHSSRITAGLLPDIGAYELAQASFSTEVFSTENKISAFPNPLIDHIFLKNAPENAICTFVNSIGQIIFFGKNIDKVDFSELSNGVYFLKIDDRTSIKIVK
jgi:hypothetical protein